MFTTILSGALSISLIFHFAPSLTVVTKLVAIAALSLIFKYLFTRIFSSIKNVEVKDKLKLLAASAVLGILFLMMFPFHLSEIQTISIEALGSKNANSKGSEVWVRQLQVDDRIVALEEMQLLGDWEIKNGVPVSYKNQPSQLIWKGIVRDEVKITLVKHPYSGQAKISLNDKINNIDLYSETDQLAIESLQPKTNVILSAIVFLADAIVLASLIFCTIARLLRYESKNQEYVRDYSFFIIPLSVWMVYFLSFYPGLMSGDSIDQWRQISTLELYDAHPVFHTLLNWLLTRLWFSPAIIALSQMLFLSLIFAYSMKVFRRMGVSNKILIPVLIIFSIMPLSGMMVNSLWKDIPYSISLLWLTILLLLVYQTNGAWLEKRKNQLLIGFVLVLVLMFRHNGLIAFFGVSLGLFLFYRRYWRQVAVVVVASFSIFLIIKIPLYNYFQVKPVPSVLTLSVPINQMGAFLYNGIELDDSDKEVVNKIMPLELWSKNFNPYIVDPLIYNKQFDMVIFDSDKSIRNKFLLIWLKTAIQHPKQAISAWLYQTSIIWRMDQPINSSTYTTEQGIVKTGSPILDRYNLQTKSFIPEIKAKIISIVDFTQKPSFIWLFWRPAIFLFITFLFGFIMIYRNHWKLSIIAFPTMFNMFGLTISIPAQQVRYMYPSILVTFIFVVLAFITLKRKEVPR
ncbi:DUF6020 family protein [Paenibacillus ehimensis]|uniref:DUF6020 family protein n=1 Tax=Paenibacillus ehimensis TaxID=79264 RepID=UPI002DB84258|nr:DUF6020 family protein [Paenibacillus ehimensis]MEC0213248.1 DUF6020 family protein [Paenibacillus ehimensis]